MANQKSNKELVAAGHAFAKTLDADKPIIEIAKLITELSSRLDVVNASLKQMTLEKDGAEALMLAMRDDSHESRSQLELLTAENEALVNYIDAECYTESQRTGVYTCAGINKPPAPATNAMVNEIRAEGVEMFGDFWQRNCGHNDAFISKEANKYADQLREKAGNEVKAAIQPMPVERDQYGYWTHPEYNKFCDGRESIPAAEFAKWLSQQGLECSIQYRAEEEIDPNVDGYDISSWKPEAPADDGWFVASILDTEDGAVCVWLRPDKDGE